MTISPDSPQQHPRTDGELCICGHPRHRHADATPAMPYTRCVALEDRRDLIAVLEDGIDYDDDTIAYCGCLQYAAHLASARGDAR